MTAIAPHTTAFFQQRLPIERGASSNTSDSYAYAFTLLLKYASERLKVPPSQLDLEQIDAPLVVSFLNHLETARANGPSSRNVRLAAIKTFMHFMEYRVPSAMEQIRRILAIPAKKADTRLVKHLTVEEMQSILDAPRTDRLGHAHMQTTEMYTRADPSVKLETLEAMIAPRLRSGRFQATDTRSARAAKVTIGSTALVNAPRPLDESEPAGLKARRRARSTYFRKSHGRPPLWERFSESSKWSWVRENRSEKHARPM